jgi:mannose-6-phosphate isomerase-like protein (cupin superfamily)
MVLHRVLRDVQRGRDPGRRGTPGGQGHDLLLAMSLIEQVTPPGFASSLRLHHGEDEPMYVLEGRHTFWVGDRIVPAQAGTFGYLPRGVPRCLRVEGPAPGRLLQLTQPGGLERGFQEMGSPAAGPVLPPPPAGPPDPAELTRQQQITARHRVELLGPPPGQPGFPLPEPHA